MIRSSVSLSPALSSASALTFGFLDGTPGVGTGTAGGGDEGNQNPSSHLAMLGGKNLRSCTRLLILSKISLPKALRAFVKEMVEMKGIEPLTPCLQGRCSPS